jgi:hypothetical protein
MPYAYSEDPLIEQTAIAIFKDLKWETANVYQGEKFGSRHSFATFDESND